MIEAISIGSALVIVILIIICYYLYTDDKGGKYWEDEAKYWKTLYNRQNEQYSNAVKAKNEIQIKFDKVIKVINGEI